MTHENKLRSSVDSLPESAGEASAEEVSASVERVWRRMQPDVLRSPTEERSIQSRLPHRHQRAWTFLPRAVAAVLVFGVAIGTAIVWPRGVRVYAAGNDGLQVTLGGRLARGDAGVRRDDGRSCA